MMYGNRAGEGGGGGVKEKKRWGRRGVGKRKKKRWGRGGRGEQMTKNIKVQKGTGF